ncbi:MAG: type II toxin-antitoxin system VapC family toxin, partial [Hyphomicrobiales bacterium]|nr:type II toxin-antitoxin system VapC family toxin [Hyphomicrobiales bacterium]
MNTLVVDASVVIKWVVEEEGTQHALVLRGAARLIAPDLLVAECANILWKKVQRGELTREEADLAAQLIERADIELFPMRGLLHDATRIAIEISHPAYDCIYLALAMATNARFVTADERLLQKLRFHADTRLTAAVVSLAEA